MIRQCPRNCIQKTCRTVFRRHIVFFLLLFSCPVVCNSLWSHGLQHVRPPYPSPSPGVCTSSCSLHLWCHPAISSSDALFSFCSQSFPTSGTFLMSHLFISDNQNTGASASALGLPMNIQGWSPLRLTDLISLLPKGISGVFSTPQLEGISSLAFSILYRPALTTIHNLWENRSLDNTDRCWQSNVSPFQHTV